MVLAAGAGFYLMQGSLDSTSPALAPVSAEQDAKAATDRSESLLAIAVLPFESFSEDRGDQYFADGLADALLHRLAQLQTLTVIARNSSFQFKGRNLDFREIGEKLGVPTVLEGSVQRNGDRIRVIAQLVNTENAAHWWSGTFDGTFANIFELRDEIAGAIAEQLQITLSDRDRERLYRSGTRTPEAYDMLERARAIEDEFDADTYDLGTDRKLQLLERVVEIDPNYALGWAFLAGYYNSLAFQNAVPDRTEELVRKCREAAERAIEVDPDEERGYVALGFSYWRERDLGPAEEAYRTALSINPNSEGALAGLGLLMLGKNPEQALRLFTRVRQIDPGSEIVHRQLYFALAGLGRLDEAVAQLEEGIRQAPDFHLLHDDLASAYADSFGRYDEAARVASSLLSRSPVSRTGMINMVEQWLAVNDLARGEAWLAALEDRHPGHNETQFLQVRMAARRGDFAGATEMVRSIRAGVFQVFQQRLVTANLCLFLDDKACSAQQLNMLEELMTAMAGRGMEMPGLVELLVALFKAALEVPDTRTSEAHLAALAESTRDWTLLSTGSQDLEFRSLFRAMALAQLGRPADALAELHSTLDIADGGFDATTISGVSPESAYFFGPLRGLPEFDEWFARLDARRQAMRERMIRMETAGEIIRGP